MTIRTLIVDDEPLARSKIHTFLIGEEDFEVVGECASGTEAISVDPGDQAARVEVVVGQPDGTVARALPRARAYSTSTRRIVRAAMLRK